jgi:ubiquinone/menaquinone biosynthesis C-methylase UbiE
MYRHRFTHFTDALIPVYNRVFKVLAGRRHEAFREHVIELTVLGGNGCLLDAGCGTGMTALRIAARYPGCTVHGIDISPNMIAVARRDADKQGLAVEFRVGSITDLPYPDDSFDVVTTNIMYHHLDLAEKRQAVAEIARVLKPGGRYVSAEFGPRARNALQRHLANWAHLRGERRCSTAWPSSRPVQRDGEEALGARNDPNRAICLHRFHRGP